MEGEMQLSVTPFLSNHAVLQCHEALVGPETAEPGAWYFRRFRPEGRMNCG